MAGDRPSLMIVDDDRHLVTQIVWALRDEFDIRSAHDRPAAIAALEADPPDLLLLDLCLPPDNVPEEGFRILQAARRRGGDTLVVISSALEERSSALRAITEGAYDVFQKPADLDTLRIVLRRALERQTLERENRRLRDELSRRFSVDGLIGVSEPMNRVAESIRRVADAAVTVLIQGESGTGKELVARAIHFSGARRAAPFVPVNCAALPETLLEAELSGHERGAFTGAVASRAGRFEAADGGTLFLDEIGCLTPSAQVTLLRVLEDRRVERLGSNKSRPVDIRLIAATNEDLREKVERGAFREDLFFRIAVFPIKVPALRDRAGDIPLLAEHFMHAARTERGARALRFSPEAMIALAAHDWRGNVRELRNKVESAALLADGDEVTVEHLALAPPAAAPGQAVGAGNGAPVDFKTSVEAYEKRLLVEAIRNAGGKKAEAARQLGLDQGQMKYLVRKYAL